MTVGGGARGAFFAALLLMIVAAPSVWAGEPPPYVEPAPAAPQKTDATPAEGESTPDEGVTAPDEGVTRPAEGVTTPDEGVTTPDESGTEAPEAAAPAPETTPSTAAPSPLDKIRAAVNDARYGTAVLYCEQALAGAGDTEAALELRAVCARSYVGLGDKLYAVGSPAAARERWDQAAALDPRLLDDPAFTARLEAADGATSKTPEPPVAPPKPEEEPPPVEPVRPADAGPRWDRGFGAGLGAGFDGAGALLFSWMTDGTIAVDFSVGVIFPVFDIRVRWFGLQEPLTPVLGLGMTSPFGDGNRFGGGLDAFHNLYELGESFHVDIGASWAPTEHLDVFAGIAFVTPVDQDNPDTVLFFPQFAAQVVWYF